MYHFSVVDARLRRCSSAAVTLAGTGAVQAPDGVVFAQGLRSKSERAKSPEFSQSIQRIFNAANRRAGGDAGQSPGGTT